MPEPQSELPKPPDSDGPEKIRLVPSGRGRKTVPQKRFQDRLIKV